MAQAVINILPAMQETGVLSLDWEDSKSRSGGLVFPALPLFVVIHTVKGFRIVNKAEGLML